MSENLKQTITETERLKLELNATEHLVLQYEAQNEKMMREIEDQAKTNEDIAVHLERKTRVQDLRSRQDQEFRQSEASIRKRPMEDSAQKEYQKIESPTFNERKD